MVAHLSPPVGDVHAGTAEHHEEVHAVDTDAGIVPGHRLVRNRIHQVVIIQKLLVSSKVMLSVIHSSDPKDVSIMIKISKDQDEDSLDAQVDVLLDAEA